MRNSRLQTTILATMALMLTIGTTALLPAANREELSARIDDLYTSSDVTSTTTITLKVKDLETGEILFDRGGDRLLTPASNLKIYTSACALDTWGAEHRFTTTVGYTGTISENVLRGDLVFVGGGDPMLTSKELLTLGERALTEFGIKRIAGNIVIDQSLYTDRLKGPGWMWDDDPDYYNMSVTPLMVDYNVLTVKATPGVAGSMLPVVALNPPSGYPPIELVLKPNGTAFSITREPFRHGLIVSGGRNGEAKDARLNMHDPGRWIGGMLLQHYITMEIPVDGIVRVTRDKTTLAASFQHQSVTLRDAVRHFNKTSENAVGEVLLLNLSARQNQGPATWPAGATAITTWLTEKAGLAPNSFRLVDGSGLSRYNLISADSSIRLLSYTWTHPEKDAFFDSLPVYKVDLPEGSTETTERIHAKPGGMGGVTTLSGYIQTLEGRWLAFSFLANGYVGSNQPIRDFRGKIFSELITYTP